MEVAVLAEAGLRELKEKQRVLHEAGIEAGIIRPPNAACTTCALKLWLAVPPEDAERAVAALQADWYRKATPEQRRAAAEVVDHNAPEITCPACGATFATGPTECPSCGLALM